MHRKVFFSLAKISLLLLIVGFAFSRSQISSSSAAFFTSMISGTNGGVSFGDWTPPDSPLFWVEEDTTQVKLDWLASTDATGYKVYRSTDNVSFSAIATLGNVTSYTDGTAAVGTSYYYKVTAVDASANESDPTAVVAKYAGTKDIVIDDDANGSDFNSNGTVSTGGTGSWDKYATTAGSGVNVVPSVLQNAVGGDNYSTSSPATGQTYSWQTTANLNGEYDVFAQYICDPSRTVARYDVFSGATKLNSSSIDIYQSRADGLAASAPCASQASSSVVGPQWVKLGTFAFNNEQGKVVLTAQAGEVYILADAVAFHPSGVTPSPTPTPSPSPSPSVEPSPTPSPTPTPEPVSPLSYLTVSNSQPKRVENRIENGSFESGLNNWNVSGDVNLINGADGTFALPQQGSNMLRIGSTTNQGNPARVNILSQQIPAGVRTLGFYYNMFTYDYKGFDDPGFMVFVNNKMVFQRWASEVDRDDPLAGTTNLDSSGWQYFGIDLSQYPEGTTLTLAFYAGNDNTNMASSDPHQTWVYLDNFSTNEAVVNAQSQFEIHTTAGATAKYRIGSDPTIHVGNTFTLSAQPSNQTIYYWAENGSLVEPTNSFHVLYDNVAPEAVDDLSGSYLNDNLFKLNWLSPRDDNQFTAPFSRPTNAAGYEIKYSTTPFDSTVDWNSPALKPVTIVTEDGLPYGGYRAPRPENEQEEYYVRVADAGTEYYFAVRSYDAATNTSTISNVAHVSVAGGTTVDNSSDIVINEFLPDPVGDDTATKPNGEWVELYNKSNTDIDVNGWALYDADNSHELIISASNSDNNLDLTDGGETVVPANGWLVVYRNGDADFDLDNASTDTVRLYNKPITDLDSLLIDSHDYTPAGEGKSYARIPDGTVTWVDPVPTPGRPNATTQADLQPQARIWNQTAGTAKISVFDALNYTTADYLIEYTYNDGTVQQDAITGSLNIDSQRIDKNDLVFGSCSTGGECTYHPNVDASSIKLTVTLHGTGMPDRTLIQPLTGAWH